MRKEMKSLVVSFLCFALSCGHDECKNEPFGIDLGIFMQAINMEKTVGMEPMETMQNYDIRIYKLESLGSDKNTNDFVIEIKISTKNTDISIWKLKKEKILSFKVVSLEENERLAFEDMIDNLRPQFLSNLYFEGANDEKENFILRFRYQCYNQYFLENIDENKKSRQGLFVQYLRNLINRKTNLIF
jgi:hypothetical protein